MSPASFADFSRIFHGNIATRSRTAKGVSDTKVSTVKKPLLKSGEELKERVEENTAMIIEFLWASRYSGDVTSEWLRVLSEFTYDQINLNLQVSDPYAKERAEIEKANGCRTNSRYRVWDAKYGNRVIPLEHLEDAMDEFYVSFAEKIHSASKNIIPQAQLLAWTDWSLDQEIHPWADSCGRHATAMVMWLSAAIPGFRLPIFGNREEHYASMKDLAKHTAYYAACLSRE